MIEVLLIFSGLLIGFGIGQLVRDKLTRSTKVGTLRIDHSDPYDGPHIFLELEPGCGPSFLSSQKFVTLEVNEENYISHE